MFFLNNLYSSLPMQEVRKCCCSIFLEHWFCLGHSCAKISSVAGGVTYGLTWSLQKVEKQRRVGVSMRLGVLYIGARTCLAYDQLKEVTGC